MQRSRTIGRLLPTVVAAALVGGAAGGVLVHAVGSSEATDDAGAGILAPASAHTAAGNLSASLRPAVLTPEEVYVEDSPGVVVITATTTQQTPATPFTPPGQQQVQSLGSGFVIDERGDVVTNDHVVQGATNVRVGFSGGSTFPARVIGTDASTDIAVVRVRVPAGALHPLTFADSAAVRVGDPVYAIGNPFGLDRTLTAGVISAIGRAIQAPNGLSIPDAIQTDAAINHGNSGGPLIDRHGRVVGITSQIDTGGTSEGNVGIGFAVPSATVRTVSDELIRTGHAEHAWLGVLVEPIDAQVAAVVRGLPRKGVLVASVVRGSPAAKAGLAAGNRQVTVDGIGIAVGGDAIVSIDGKPVETPSDLADAVAAHRPGDDVSLGVVRNGATRTVTVTLGSAPNSP